MPSIILKATQFSMVHFVISYTQNNIVWSILSSVILRTTQFGPFCHQLYLEKHRLVHFGICCTQNNIIHPFAIKYNQKNIIWSILSSVILKTTQFGPFCHQVYLEKHNLVHVVVRYTYFVISCTNKNIVLSILTSVVF